MSNSPLTICPREESSIENANPTPTLRETAFAGKMRNRDARTLETNEGSAFLKERKIPDLIFYEVSKDVNKPTNNSASLIQKL